MDIPFRNRLLNTVLPPPCHQASKIQLHCYSVESWDRRNGMTGSRGRYQLVVVKGGAVVYDLYSLYRYQKSNEISLGEYLDYWNRHAFTDIFTEEQSVLKQLLKYIKSVLTPPPLSMVWSHPSTFHMYSYLLLFQRDRSLALDTRV